MRWQRSSSMTSSLNGGSPLVSVDEEDVFDREGFLMLRGAAILGGPLVTIGLFIFAWTIYPDVHWIAPIIGSAVFGAG